MACVFLMQPLLGMSTLCRDSDGLCTLSWDMDRLLCAVTLSDKEDNVSSFWWHLSTLWWHSVFVMMWVWFVYLVNGFWKSQFSSVPRAWYFCWKLWLGVCRVVSWFEICSFWDAHFLVGKWPCFPVEHDAVCVGFLYYRIMFLTKVFVRVWLRSCLIWNLQFGINSFLVQFCHYSFRPLLVGGHWFLQVMQQLIRPESALEAKLNGDGRGTEGNNLRPDAVGTHTHTYLLRCSKLLLPVLEEREFWTPEGIIL